MMHRETYEHARVCARASPIEHHQKASSSSSSFARDNNNNNNNNNNVWKKKKKKKKTKKKTKKRTKEGSRTVRRGFFTSRCNKNTPKKLLLLVFVYTRVHLLGGG